MKSIIIAIDGYSSTGKSTIAKALAKRLSYKYIDTGAMYRAVTLFALREGVISSGEIDKKRLLSHLSSLEISFVLDAGNNSVVSLNGEIVEGLIRGMEVSSWVSKISAIPEVRELLVAQQQRMGSEKGVIMDGRDIGSVVFPDAELKLFMTASEDIRAKRRYDELCSKGEQVSLEQVKKNLLERDHRDVSRKIAPLIQTSDAIVLDNSAMSQEEQLNWVLDIVAKL